MVEETFMAHHSLHVSQMAHRTHTEREGERKCTWRWRWRSTLKKQESKKRRRREKKKPLMWKEAKREYLEIPLVASYCLPSK